MASELGRAGYSGLGSDNGVLTDFNIMGNLNEVVELHALVDVCRTHSSTVNGGVGANFHVVVDNHVSYLCNFLISGSSGSKSEAVGTNYSTCVNDTAVADSAAVIDFHAGIEDYVVADCHAITHINLGIYFHMLSDGDTLPYVGKGTEIDVVGEGYAFAHKAWLLDSHLFFSHMAIDKVEQVGKSSVGVGYANESCIDVLLGHKIIAYEHSRCISGVYKMGIFRVCQKSEASLLSFFDFREIVDNDITVAFNRSFHKFSQLACG